MKNDIKPATQEEVKDQTKTVKVDKKLELTNEINVLKKELKQNKLVLEGGTNEKGQLILSSDELIENFSDLIEMKEIELAKDLVEPANRRYLFESDSRHRELTRKLIRVPEIDRFKRQKQQILKQKADIIENDPKIAAKLVNAEKELKALE